MVAFKIELPHVGESVTEAIIGKWLKSPGEHIEKYDPLVEVITDKVNMDVPAPASGTLTKLLAAEGDTVPMGSVIAEMETDEANVQGDSRWGQIARLSVSWPHRDVGPGRKCGSNRWRIPRYQPALARTRHPASDRGLIGTRQREAALLTRCYKVGRAARCRSGHSRGNGVWWAGYEKGRSGCRRKCTAFDGISGFYFG